MERATNLIYREFKSTNRGFKFYYEIDDKEYSFWISVKHSEITIDTESKMNIVFHIGLSFLVDIAVICCPKNIIIKPAFLSAGQLKMWKWLYEQASLEKAYDEKEELYFLDTLWLVDSDHTYGKMFEKKRGLENITISMSGGKESLTALKLFKNYPNLSLFFFDYNDKNSFHMRKAYEYLKSRFNYHQINTNISHTKQLVKRYKSKDYSLSVIAQLVFNSLLFSDKIDYFIVGNEYSSNFGNAEYKGLPVNHQYDKTIEFAKIINDYIKQHFNSVILYTSPFFGMYEYRIAEIFLSDSEYLNIWTSCNKSNSKHNFCCKCHKCAFIYIVSLPFVDKQILDKYFFKSPLEDLKLSQKLIDIDSEKPTDCVGEKKECWVALYNIIKQNKAPETTVIKYFSKVILPMIEKDLDEMERQITSEQTQLEYLPPALLKSLPDSFFHGASCK